MTSPGGGLAEGYLTPGELSRLGFTNWDDERAVGWALEQASYVWADKRARFAKSPRDAVPVCRLGV